MKKEEVINKIQGGLNVTCQGLPEEPKLVATNLEFTNSGKYMGDNDGPAYVVYSKIGYNKGSFDFAISQVKINMVRKSDKKWTNCYIFLGADVYDSKDEFLNCIDAGFAFGGGGGGWHLFYNRLIAEEGMKWYESEVTLDSTHDYRIVLDCSIKDEWARLSVIDLTDGNTELDSAEFGLKYAKKDGSNISIYQDYAIDYPDDIKCTTDGKPSEDDWEEITLYNTNEGLYLKNINIANATLYDTKGSYIWTTDRTNDRFMWPHTKMPKVDYPCTSIRSRTEDTSLLLDLDMNR